MAKLEDFKFNAGDFTDKDISSLPNNPSKAGFTAQQLKERFDMVPKLVIAMGKLNQVFDFLTGGEGAASLGAVNYQGETQKVQELLDSLKADINSTNGDLANLAGTGRTNETVMGAYAKAAADFSELAGAERTDETVKGAYAKLDEYKALLRSIAGAGEVGAAKLYPDDTSDDNVAAKLLKLTELVLQIDKFTPRGILDRLEDLPLSGNAYGDFYYIRTTDPNIFNEYVWIDEAGGRWQHFGEVSNYVLNNYYTKSETYNRDEVYNREEIDEKAYVLPTASTSVLGGVKVGNYLTMANGVLSVNSNGLAPVVGPKIVSGRYTGDGTQNRTINVGFTPKFVMAAPIRTSTSKFFLFDNFFYCESTGSATHVGDTVYTGDYQIGIVYNGFIASSANVGLNGSGLIHSYIAFA